MMSWWHCHLWWGQSCSFPRFVVRIEVFRFIIHSKAGFLHWSSPYSCAWIGFLKSGTFAGCACERDKIKRNPAALTYFLDAVLPFCLHLGFDCFAKIFHPPCFKSRTFRLVVFTALSYWYKCCTSPWSFELGYSQVSAVDPIFPPLQGSAEARDVFFPAYSLVLINSGFLTPGCCAAWHESLWIAF